MSGSIKSFTIENLFNKYKISIPFNEPIKVLVGENGIGKTTVLNAFFYCISRDFHRLREIDFTRIFLTFNSGEEAIISKENIFGRTRRALPVEMARLERFLPRYEYDKLVSMVRAGIPLEKTKYEDVLESLDISYSKLRFYVNNLEEKSEIQKAEEIIQRNIVKENIVYLPTYRRIEEDLGGLNISINDLSESLANLSNKQKTQLDFKPIQFGMADVKNRFNRIEQDIKISSRESLVKVSAAILRDFIKSEERQFTDIDKDKLFIVIDWISEYLSEEEKIKIKQSITNDSFDNNKINYYYFMTKLADIYKAQEAKEAAIEKFIKICNENYLHNKEVVYDKSSVHIWIRDKGTGKEIRLDKLSSGEKQMIGLLSKIYLEDSKNLIILFDEPELSLSMEWQEKLLPDIYKSGKCEFLMAVTHSPFIFRNDFVNYTVGLDVYMEELKREYKSSKDDTSN